MRECWVLYILVVLFENIVQLSIDTTDGEADIYPPKNKTK